MTSKAANGGNQSEANASEAAVALYRVDLSLASQMIKSSRRCDAVSHALGFLALASSHLAAGFELGFLFFAFIVKTPNVLFCPWLSTTQPATAGSSAVFSAADFSNFV